MPRQLENLRDIGVQFIPEVHSSAACGCERSNAAPRLRPDRRHTRDVRFWVAQRFSAAIKASVFWDDFLIRGQGLPLLSQVASALLGPESPPHAPDLRERSSAVPPAHLDV